jgi:hypothetical protein
MSAVAFIAALSIDPGAHETAVSNPPERLGEARATGGGASASTEQPSRSESNSTPSARQRDGDRGWTEWGAGLGLDAMGLGAPSVVPAVRVFGLWRRESRSWFVPELRLSALRTIGAHADAAGTHTDLGWTLGRFALSPIRLGTTTPALAISSLVDVGALEGQGAGTPRTYSRVRPWMALGGLVRGSVRVSPIVVVEAELGGFVPLFRESFAYAPGPVAYTAPGAAIFGTVSTAVQFP